VSPRRQLKAGQDGLRVALIGGIVGDGGLDPTLATMVLPSVCTTAVTLVAAPTMVLARMMIMLDFLIGVEDPPAPAAQRGRMSLAGGIYHMLTEAGESPL
jgi:hypothetical protein